MGPLPGGVGVGGEAGVDQGDGRLIVPVLEVLVKPPELVDQEHALIDNGAAGEGADIGGVGGLLKDPAGDIELPVEVDPPCSPVGPPHKALFDAGHLCQSLAAQDGGLHRDAPPAEELHSLFFHNDLEHLLGLAPLEPVLREEEHPDAVVPRLSKG